VENPEDKYQQQIELKRYWYEARRDAKNKYSMRSSHVSNRAQGHGTQPKEERDPRKFPVNGNSVAAEKRGSPFGHSHLINCERCQS
jgi:hypothetical protein